MNPKKYTHFNFQPTNQASYSQSNRLRAYWFSLSLSLHLDFSISWTWRHTGWWLLLLLSTDISELLFDRHSSSSITQALISTYTRSCYLREKKTKHTQTWSSHVSVTSQSGKIRPYITTRSCLRIIPAANCSRHKCVDVLSFLFQ